MNKLVEFPLEAGGSIWVEIIEPEPQGGPIPAGKIDDVAGRAKLSLEAALEGIRPVATAVISKVRALADQPAKVQAELGFKLSAKSGIVLASADAEANLKIVLEWSQGTTR